MDANFVCVGTYFIYGKTVFSQYCEQIEIFQLYAAWRYIFIHSWRIFFVLIYSVVKSGMPVHALRAFGIGCGKGRHPPVAVFRTETGKSNRIYNRSSQKLAHS